MPARKEVSSLVSLTLPSIGTLVELEALNVARKSVELFLIDSVEGDDEDDPGPNPELAGGNNVELAPPIFGMPLDRVRGDWMYILRHVTFWFTIRRSTYVASDLEKNVYIGYWVGTSICLYTAVIYSI